MKQSERLDLINSIAYNLQEIMTFTNIKSYFGGFNINCINHTPSFNSKRVFIQEVLANETSDLISKIARDLGLIKQVVNKNIEVFVSKKFNECITEDNEEYIANYLFQYMNDKISSNNSYGGHYNAHESKELLNTIELKDKFQQVFKNTGYAFVIDTEYLKVISECEQFLVKSGGSSIPDNFNKINIIEDRPIINLLDLSEEIQKEVSINIEEQNINKTNTNKPKNKVFIVHGHDDATKQEVARFIEKIGLESIILHEQASMNKTIIEKIEHYTQEADFAIILYTPCDKGRGALETNIEARDRARQNVVFEHGYLMARIGRKNVCAFVKGNIETPSDIAGIVYTPLDEFGGWKNKLIMELEVCGYAVKYI
ncbi:nucleotide-binding protein [Sulfurimonas sp.]|jgi:predicted nucleotide-binding protein|uniref:nucleotide-binding protein n=1 Tax=Sulfurimonas sp. TaxID=2022749 RepID=UPI0025E4B2F9|nr:nucleotide-binding protein [Sulfurimonas sp.]